VARFLDDCYPVSEKTCQAFKLLRRIRELIFALLPIQPGRSGFQ
jgi:hypothetical protein